METIAKRAREAVAEIAAQDLEIAVPFTTPELTRAALREAERLGAGLHAHVRLIKVQIVPFPLDLNRSPVSPQFLHEQLAAMPCSLPVTIEIELAREEGPGLGGALALHAAHHAVIVLVSKRRLWRTRQERLAAELRRKGHEVLVHYLEKKNA